MLKVHYDTDQQELFKACGGHMATLIDTERGVKSAASDLISREIIEKFRPDDDHFLVHNIAMGDTETYGPNKNFDGWSKEALETRHQTFVTNGHLFREHRNRDPKQKIGDIKYAAFDGGKQGMHRVELLCWGNKKKAAEEYELAKAGEPLSFSMSARILFDKCSACGNEAKTREAYCDCMKNHPGQWMAEFQKYAFVDNPDPTFFDNSRVKRPADRIAHYLEYRFPDADMRKAASEDLVILGTDWAEYEGLSIPEQRCELPLPTRDLVEKLASLGKEIQAVLEQGVPTTSERQDFMKNASGRILGEELTDAQLDIARSVRPGTLARFLAKTASILPFKSFAAYALQRPIDSLDNDPVWAKAACGMPNIMDTLLGGVDTEMLNMLQADDEFTCERDPHQKDLIQGLMDKADQEFSINPEKSKPRIMMLVIKGGKHNLSKIASELPAKDDQLSQGLALAYASYQVQALQDMQKLAGVALDEPLLLQVMLENRKYHLNTSDKN